MVNERNLCLRDIAEAVYAATNPVDWVASPGRLKSPMVELGGWRGHIEIRPVLDGVLLPTVEVHLERPVEHSGSFVAFNPFGHASALLRIFRAKAAASERNRLRLLAHATKLDQQ